jgi:hypothetical protein
MIQGTYGRLTAVALPPAAAEDIIPELSFDTAMDRQVSEPLQQFDPSTFLRISRTPLARDAYESAAVRVALSTISPLAGEGLFARRRLGKINNAKINRLEKVNYSWGKSSSILDISRQFSTIFDYTISYKYSKKEDEKN